MTINFKFLRYFIVAVLAYVVDLGGYWVLLGAGTSPVFANLIVKVVAAIFGFFMHRKFTYSFKENDGIKLHAIKYFGVALIYTPMSTLVLYILLFFIPSPILAKIVADVILFIATYAVTTHLVFTAPGSSQDEQAKT